MNNKTELQAAINHALGEMQINWEGNLFSDGDDLDLAHEIIESHIAPLLRSVRDAEAKDLRQQNAALVSALRESVRLAELIRVNSANIPASLDGAIRECGRIARVAIATHAPAEAEAKEKT